MIELKFETEIRASAERAFSLLADLRDYDRWLPRSSAFHGTVTISEGPITLRLHQNLVYRYGII